VAARIVAGQDLPALGGSPYVVDLTQGVDPAWNPYFSGLPEVFARVAPGSDGVALRGEDGAALSQAKAAAAGRPLVVAIQDAVRTPWMRAWHANVDADNLRFGAVLVDANHPTAEVVDQLLTELGLPTVLC
jgi:hypothetical protein